VNGRAEGVVFLRQWDKKPQFASGVRVLSGELLLRIASRFFRGGEQIPKGSGEDSFFLGALFGLCGFLFVQDAGRFTFFTRVVGEVYVLEQDLKARL
jgi:hypothetical protein